MKSKNIEHLVSEENTCRPGFAKHFIIILSKNLNYVLLFLAILCIRGTILLGLFDILFNKNIIQE